MGSKEEAEAIKKAYIQGGIDALTTWVDGYELGREIAKQVYK